MMVKTYAELVVLLFDRTEIYPEAMTTPSYTTVCMTFL